MNNFLFQREGVLGALRSPVFLSPCTIANHAKSKSTLDNVIGVCDRLSSDEFTLTMTAAYRSGVARFGALWGYADISTLLYAVASVGQPENYLEIGVRRGRSACMVAAASPATAIYGFDMWQENYANNDNPGAAFVAGELDKVGHTGQRHFVDGDSHVTIPEFFAANPQLTFDLITVDGDHTLEGAWDDLVNTVARLRVGGVIVFDDIDNPYCPGLLGVWERLLREFPSLAGQTVTNPLGLGVSFALRLFPGNAVPVGPTDNQTTNRLRRWLKSR